MAATTIRYCKVKGCRFSNYHTTIAHRCGMCTQYGHGQIECNSNGAKTALVRYLEEEMPDDRQCTLLSCTYPWSHSVESHHCFRCGRREHTAVQCSVGHNPSGAATKVEDTVESTIHKCCPMCREISSVDLDLTVFTDSPCPICLETKPKIIFSGCKHANICLDCAVLL
mgnify:CR=1 FL=1